MTDLVNLVEYNLGPGCPRARYGKGYAMNDTERTKRLIEKAEAAQEIHDAVRRLNDFSQFAAAEIQDLEGRLDDVAGAGLDYDLGVEFVRTKCFAPYDDKNDLPQSIKHSAKLWKIQATIFSNFQDLLVEDWNAS